MVNPIRPLTYPQPKQGGDREIQNIDVHYRDDITVTLLNTGKVLVAGGNSILGAQDTAELFDSSSQSFTPITANMTVKRADFTATLLKDGKVFLAGPDLTAEIFDPSTGTFAATGSLPGRPGTTGTLGSTATLRTDGTVLVTGGQYNVGCGGPPFPVSLTLSVAAADLFDPGAESFSGTGSMSSVRTRHTATLLPNGRVLVTGGIAYTLPSSRYCGQEESVMGSAELFP